MVGHVKGTPLFAGFPEFIKEDFAGVEIDDGDIGGGGVGGAILGRLDVLGWDLEGFVDGLGYGLDSDWFAGDFHFQKE